MDYCVICAVVERNGERPRRKPYAFDVASGLIREFSNLPAIRRLVEAGQARHLTKEQAEEFARQRAHWAPPYCVDVTPHRLADGWRAVWMPRSVSRKIGHKPIQFYWTVHPILSPAAGLGLERLPPVQLRRACTTLADDKRYDEVKRLEAVAAACVRAAVYASYRGGYLDDNDRGHDQCVAAANKAVRQVRKALGYDTTPDLKF